MSASDVAAQPLEMAAQVPSPEEPEVSGTVARSGRVLLRPVDFDPFGEAEPARSLPTTDAQRDVWYASQGGDEAHCAHLQLFSLHFQGALRSDLLAEALQALVRRHEALRSRFSPCGDRVSIAPSATIGMPLIDLAKRPPGERASEVSRLEDREARTAFDLTAGPPVRATLLRTDVDRHVLLLTIHQLVADAWSMGVLLDELGALYSAAVREVQPRLSPPDSFVAHAERAAAQADSTLAAEARAHWRSVFERPSSPPALPADRSPTAARTHPGGRRDRRLERALVDSLKQLGSRHGCTQAGAFLAALMAFLHRLGGQTDLVVGLSSAGQASSGRTRLVGQCVNVLPMRHEVRGETSFKALLASLRPGLLDAFQHSRQSLGRLVETLRLRRDPDRPPLSSVLLTLVEHESDVAFEGLRFGYRSRPRAFETLAWRLEVVLLPEGAELQLSYAADLFEARTIDRRLEEFETLLRAVLAAPGAPLDSLPLLGAEERALLDDLSGLSAAQPSPGAPVGPRDDPLRQPVHRRVAARAAAHPEAVVLESEGRAMGAAELVARTGALTRRLVRGGFGKGQVAAVCLEHAPDTLVALLAVLEAGGAYVPLEAVDPPERIGFVLEDSEASVLLTDARTVAGLPRHGARTLLLDDDGSAAGADDAPLDVQLAADDLAYLAYTEGPTGKLRGAELTHGGLADLLASLQRAPLLSAEDVFVAVTSLSRDASAVELFLPLLTGARLVLAGRGVAADSSSLMALLARSNATAMKAEPAVWQGMIDAGWAGDSGLRALSAGAPVSPALVAELRPRCKELWNLYGLPEATAWSTAGRLEVGEPVSIGRPLEKVQVHVLDAGMQRVPVGVVGELCIGGAGVARGYRRRPGLSAERFVRDRFGAPTEARILRTGDRGRYRADGRLEWLGRWEPRLAPAEAGQEAGPPEPTPSARPFVAPRDDLELRLQCMWRRGLGLRHVGVADDFFDRGGHSLLAMALLAEVRERFGAVLGVGDFLSAPTIGEQAELLRRGAGPGQTASHLDDALLIREASAGSTRPPVICVCGRSVYYELAQQLHPDHGVLAVYRDVGRGASGPPSTPSLQAVAADYLEVVTRAQAQGPYYLVGASFGGVLAFEMAQQLRAAGQEVGLVALLDAPGPGERRPSFVRRAFFHARQVRQQGSGYVTRRLRAGTRGELPSTLLDPVRSRFEPSDAKPRRAARQRVFLDVLRRYRAQPYPGRLELFLAEQRGEADALLGDPVPAWHAVAPGRLVVHRVPGEAAEMLRGSSVVPLGRALQASLDAALEGRPPKG